MGRMLVVVEDKEEWREKGQLLEIIWRVTAHPSPVAHRMRIYAGAHISHTHAIIHKIPDPSTTLTYTLYIHIHFHIRIHI